MSKLLKRKKELPWDVKYCNACKTPLVLKTCKKHGEHHWCVTCKDWRYPEYYHVGRKKRGHLQPEIIKVHTNRMRQKLDDYMEGFVKRETQNIKVYRSEEYAQTYLLTLIPK